MISLLSSRSILTGGKSLSSEFSGFLVNTGVLTKHSLEATHVAMFSVFGVQRVHISTSGFQLVFLGVGVTCSSFRSAPV